MGPQGPASQGTWDQHAGPTPGGGGNHTACQARGPSRQHAGPGYTASPHQGGRPPRPYISPGPVRRGQGPRLGTQGPRGGVNPPPQARDPGILEPRHPLVRGVPASRPMGPGNPYIRIPDPGRGRRGPHPGTWDQHAGPPRGGDHTACQAGAQQAACWPGVYSPAPTRGAGLPGRI